jgi:hypothetical protein
MHSVPVGQHGKTHQVPGAFRYTKARVYLETLQATLRAYRDGKVDLPPGPKRGEGLSHSGA